jgi:outer membrane biogenesis lipoprotein LolB
VSLHYWALGIPDPASPAEIVFDEEGLLRELTQRDWQVSFDRYTERGGQPMPRVLVAVSEDIKVRLVIHNWTFR